MYKKNLFNYDNAINFFSFDYETGVENFCFKYEERIRLLLYKAVVDKNNINFKILFGILKFFVNELTNIVKKDVCLSAVNVETMIYKLWFLYNDNFRDNYPYEVPKLYNLVYSTLDIKDTHVNNMRNLIIRTLLNIKKYLAVKNNKYNKFINLEELINLLEKEKCSDDVNIANIVRTSIEAVYPQCDMWINKKNAWDKFLDRVYPNHSKLLNHIEPSDGVLTDIQYGYMPAYNLDDDDWSMIENHDFLSWMGFNLNPDHDVIVCDDGKIFIISDYNEDLRGGIYSYAAWVRENHEWKFQPIEFWH